MEEKKFEFDERAPYAYFQNSACPYFPCHEKGNKEFFNCLFCYCPLSLRGCGLSGFLQCVAAKGYN